MISLELRQLMKMVVLKSFTELRLIYFNDKFHLTPDSGAKRFFGVNSKFELQE